MMKIHCIGDSHVSLFSGLDAVGRNYDALPFFKTYWMGPLTAYKAIERKEIMDTLLREDVKAGDKVLLCFGEIDCRAHLVKQAELRKEPLEKVVRQCVENYFELFLALKGLGYDVMAWNAPPPSMEDIEFGEYSTYGSYSQRLEATWTFNRILKELCGGNDIPFISIFEKLVGPDGLTNPLIFMDEIHLSQRVMPFVIDEFKEMGMDFLSGEKEIFAGEKTISEEKKSAAAGPVSVSEATPGSHRIINMVYQHLLEAQRHALSKDNVSVVWSSTPLKGCDLYAYLNAFSFAGKEEGVHVLLLWEPYVVLPGQWDEKVWSQFDHILTLYSALTKRGTQFRRISAPRSGWIVPVDITEDREERERKYSLKERKNAICMINGHKNSDIPGELYSKRLEAAKWFHENSDIPFDIYGNPPFPLPNYRGVLEADNKLPTMAGYMYALCFENFYHPEYSAGYITEKILDCLETRTVPIYLGCSDIEKYIPKDCFIDFRDFKDFRELNEFLAGMSRKRYKKYTHSIDEWVMGGNLRQYSWQALYDRLAGLLGGVPGSFSREKWINGISPAIKDHQWILAESQKIWSYEHLATTVPPLVKAITGEQKASLVLVERTGRPGPSPEKSNLKLQRAKSPEGSLKESFLQQMADAFRAEVFIQTGNYPLNATCGASAVFPEVYLNPTSQLPTILKQIEGKRALLWLNADSRIGVTEHEGGNRGIIEEIKVLSELQVKKDLIFLFDDLRFFGNCKGTAPKDSGLEEYPAIAGVCGALLDLDGSMQFAAIGDILLAYPESADIRVSPVLHAATVSRFYEEANFPEELVLRSEEIIGNAEGTELRAIQGLVKENLEAENRKMGGHYRLWHGLTLHVRQFYDEACLEFLVAMQTGVRDWRLYWYIGRSAFMAENFILARKALEAVAKAAPEFAASKELLRQMEAVPEYAESSKPLTTQAHLALGQFFQNEGSFAEAIGEFQQVLFSGVVDGNLYYQYAQLLIATGQYDRSIEELTKVLTLNPTHTYAHNDLGVIYQQKQLYDEAIGAFEKAVSSDNRNYNALRNLIRLFLARQNREGAMRVARLLLTNHPLDHKLKEVVKEFDLPLGTSAIGPDGFEGVIYGKDSDAAEEAAFRKKAADYYKEMRELYGLDSTEGPIYRFVHPVWKQQLDTLGALISDGIPDNFLYHPICLEMFVRAGWQKQQQYELDYLENLDHDLKEKIFSIKETDVGILHRTCPGHDISINTLGMLWYCARIAEHLSRNHSSIVEFGGGFGSFARVYNLFAENPLTYTIIDLPEMLALQLYYLGLSLGDESVVAHRDTSEPLVQGKINLYPVYGLEQLNISADLFVSTFALSETPGFTQEMVCSTRKFFGASDVYITGQLETERSELSWQKPQTIVLTALHRFRHLELNHFHIGDNYELMASDEKNRSSAALERGRAREEGGISAQSEKVVGIIFSKDRAMQLDCTLGSLALHCMDGANLDLHVLYTTSDSTHQRQYEELKKAYPAVTFVRERSFKEDLLSLLAGRSKVLFLVDDNIFVDDFEVADAVRGLDENPDALGFSLRLGKNTAYCYMVNKTQELPPFEVAGQKVLRFDWTAAELDFGYPLEVSSSIYRVADLLPLLGLDYRNPNTLELMLDTNKHVLQGRRKSLLCFGGSVTFCNPANMVQTMWVNRAGDKSTYSAQKLAGMFDQGLRVDVAAYSGFVPNGCHQEVEFKFLRERSKKAGRPLISIMIISYNGIDHIKACIESIKRNTPEEHEIVVVDNARSDGSLDYIKSVSGVTVIENPSNIGYSPARAQAMAVVRGEYIISLDDDTIVTKGWAKRLIRHLEAHPELGIIGPRSNYVSGPQIVADARYTNISEMEAFAEAWSEAHEGELTPAYKLIGFCMCIPRKVLDKIGCIDYNFGKLFGFDDDDYSLRTQVAGFKLAIADDVFIHHTGGPQGKGSKEYNELLLGAWEMFKKKWRLPEQLKYGEAYNIGEILSQPFDPARHYTKPLEPASIVRLAREEEAKTEGTAQWYYNNALKMQTEGNMEGAQKNLEIVLTMDPSHADAHNDLGVLYYQKGEAEKALAFISKAVDLEPGNAENLKNKADLSLELGRTEEAIEAYGKVLAINPENVDTLLTVGNLNAQANRFEDAIMFFSKVLEIDKENPIARENIDFVSARVAEQGR